MPPIVNSSLQTAPNRARLAQGHYMAEPVYFKRSFSVATVALLTSMMPAIVGTASLYFVALAYDVKFDSLFVLLTVLIATLSALLYQPLGNGGSQLTANRVNVAFSVLVRWA